jgi:hypothetical protein
MALGLGACSPDNQEQQSGSVSLTFDRQVGPNFLFTLDNNTFDEISFEGWREQGGYVSPAGNAYSYRCKSSDDSDALFKMPVSDLHGPGVESIELNSGEKLTIAFHELRFAPAGAGKCQVTLILDGGAKIESPELIR